MLFTAKQTGELQTLPPPYIPGPYATDVTSVAVPSLVSLAVRALFPYPDQIQLPVRLPLRHRRLLDELVPDPACLDPRLWATLVQLYDGLPPYLSSLALPLSDIHLPLLQSIASTRLFSLVTILSLPGCVHLTDDTVLQLKFLHSLSAFDASATTLSSYALQSLAASLQLNTTDDPDGRRHRGPWQIRILSLRNCKNITNDAFPSLLTFPLLSAIDLRGTRCLPNKSFPFKPCSIEPLLHPTSLADSLQTLLDIQPDLYSSPHPFFINIDTLYHRPSKSTPRAISVAPQDAYVVIPSNNNSRIKIGNTLILEKQQQAREDALTHERNKDAWYERHDRLDYDIIHTRKIRPRVESSLSTFISSQKHSSNPSARPNHPSSIASNKHKTMGVEPRSHLPQNRYTPLHHTNTNSNSDRISSLNISPPIPSASTSHSRHASNNSNTPRPHLPPPHRTPTILLNRPTLTPATTTTTTSTRSINSTTLTPKSQSRSHSSQPNTSASTARNTATASYLPNPDLDPEPGHNDTTSDHTVPNPIPHHSNYLNFQSELCHNGSHSDASSDSDSQSRLRLRRLSELGTESDTKRENSTRVHVCDGTEASSSSSQLRLPIVNDRLYLRASPVPAPVIPPTMFYHRPPQLKMLNTNTNNSTSRVNGHGHDAIVMGNRTAPPPIRGPRGSVSGGHEDDDEDEDVSPANASISTLTSTTNNSSNRINDTQPHLSSFARTSHSNTLSRSTRTSTSTRMGNGNDIGTGKSKAPPASASAFAERMTDLNAFDGHLRLYRAPPPWSALEDALDVRRTEERERERRIAGYPIPIPVPVPGPGAFDGKGGKKRGGELAMVDMTSERAARVKRELDAVVQAAAKRRKLDYVLSVGVDVDIGVGGTTTGTNGRDARDRVREVASSASVGSAASFSSGVQPLPLVTESTSRNPFRRKKHLSASVSVSSSAPAATSASTLAYTPVFSTAPASASTRVAQLDRMSINADADEIINDDDGIIDDEARYDNNNNDNNNDEDAYDRNNDNDIYDYNCDDYGVQKKGIVEGSTSTPARTPGKANPSSTNMTVTTGTASAERNNHKPMLPISSVKVPVLPSKMREEALARERKESLGSGGGGGKVKGSSTPKMNGGKAKSSGQFDWKTWGKPS